MESNQTPGRIEQEESTRKMMIDVMTELGKRRSEVGVLTIQQYSENSRIDFFIAPVDTELGKSIKDGGSTDFVFATTSGFFAIRFSGVEGYNTFRYKELQDSLLNKWKRSNGEVVTDTEKKAMVFDKDPHNGTFRLDADFLMTSGRYYETVSENDPNRPFIVPAGEDIVSRAFEASKERARESKMVDPQTGVRLQQSQQAAKSLLNKMKEG